MKVRLNVTKSVDGDLSMPMATTKKSADDYDKGVCRWYGGRVRKLPIGLWRCSSLSRGGIVLCFP